MRITDEGLDRLEESLRDERDFTADSAMVAYRLMLEAIADLRDARVALRKLDTLSLPAPSSSAWVHSIVRDALDGGQ